LQERLRPSWAVETTSPAIERWREGCGPGRENNDPLG
jgi:hypothetical protein